MKNFELIKKIIIFIVCVLILTIVIYLVVNTIQFFLVQKAASNIPSVYPISQVRFIIYGSSEDTVSGCFRFYDNYGREQLCIERSWKGPSLSIEFSGASFSGKNIFFPSVLYSNTEFETKLSYGTSLISYFIKDGKCTLYDFGSKYIKDFYRLCKFSKNAFSLLFRKHRLLYRVNLYTCVPGKYYRITTSFDGTIKLENE